MGKEGREGRGVTESSVYQRTGLGFCQHDAPRLHPFSLWRRPHLPARASSQLPPSSRPTCQGGAQRNPSRCTEKQTRHGNQRTGVSLFYL